MDKFTRKGIWDRIEDFSDALESFAWVVILVLFVLRALLWLTTKWSK